MSAEVKRKRYLAAITRGFRKISNELKAAPASPERERELERYRYAAQRRADYHLAEGVGSKYFKLGGGGLAWDFVRRDFGGCYRKEERAEFLDSVAVIGGMKPKRNLPAETPPVERLRHEALRRQHDQHFDKLCNYLSWLCEGLLPNILFNPRPDYLNYNKDNLCCWWEIQNRFGPKRSDLPKEQQAVINVNIRDLVLITNAVLTEDELRAGLLTLYFLYPEPVRSTSDKIKRRPLFQALRDVCVHWRGRDADDFKKIYDALAWNYNEFKVLKGPALARAVVSKVEKMDFEQWCDKHNRDQDSVVRQIDRALTEQLHLRVKRLRSK